MDNKYLYKNHYNLKNHNYSNDKIFFKDYQPKIKILNKYFKLEELKHEEKVSRFNDGFIDQSEKPNFFFMRSDDKIKEKDFLPTTNLCSSKRSKTCSTLLQKSIVVKGFRKYTGRKIETVFIPKNFEDIESLMEMRELKNYLMENKYLLNDKNYNKINYDLKTPKCKTRKNNIELKNTEKNTNKKKNNKITLVNDINSERKEEFTKSNILTKTKNKYNLNLDNNKNKKKRPITSKGNRKISIGIIKENKIDLGNIDNNKKRIIKSAKSRQQTQNTERENNLTEKNVKNSFANSSYKNISNYTTTFKSYSKSLSKKNRVTEKKLFKNIEKQFLNPDYIYNNQINNTPKEKNEFKSTRQIINRVLNDCYIIDRYIRREEIQSEISSQKNDKEKILLKLADKMKKNKMKQLKLKVRGKQTRIIPDDKVVFVNKLEKIKGVAKKFFREVYKQILFEKRILNKIDKSNIIDALEEQHSKKKLSEQFKKEAKEKMLLTRANIVTEEDDKKLLDEQRKLFDFYGNLDGLEWLLTKKHIMDFGNRKYKKRVKHGH